MKLGGFISGLTTGMIVGTAITMTGSRMIGKKGRRIVKNSAGKALHAIGDIVDNIASSVID